MSAPSAPSSSSPHGGDTYQNFDTEPRRDIGNSSAEAGRAGGARRRATFPRRRFGLKVPGQDELKVGVRAPSDYRNKYAADPPCKELDPDARVWLVYNDESATFDNDMISESNDSLDILLVFAGLFAGVLTTFLSQTAGVITPRSPDAPPLQPSALWINGLWFTSLTLSLATALLAVLAKQWLRQYSSFITGSIRTRALIRQFRYTSLEKWGVRLMIGLLPTLLHAALFIFLGGLVVLLYSNTVRLAHLVGAISGILLALYLISILLPIFFIHCPYRTPIAAVIYSLRRPLYTIINRAIVGPVSLALRGKSPFRRDPSHPAPASLPVRTSLMEAERAYVDRDEHIPALTKTALSWLAHSTSDPSAKAIIVEALGVENAPPLDPSLVLPVLMQQWAAFSPQLAADELRSLTDDLALGRLIRTSISQPVSHRTSDAQFFIPGLSTLDIHLIRTITIDMMLACLPTTPIRVADHATMLSVAACRRTSRFTWSDNEEVILPPQDAFQFILKHHDALSQLVLPTWMWWSICTQAAIGPKWPEPEGHPSEGHRLLHICEAFSENKRDYQMSSWIQAHCPLPYEVRNPISESGLPVSDSSSGPFAPVTLDTFLSRYFMSDVRPTSKNSSA